MLSGAGPRSVCRLPQGRRGAGIGPPASCDRGRPSATSSAPATGVVGSSQDPQRLVVVDVLTTSDDGGVMDERDAHGEPQPVQPEQPAEPAGEQPAPGTWW